MVVQERYNPIVVGANATVTVYGDNIGGFIPLTDGALTIVSFPQDGKPQTTLLTNYPVTAGFYVPLPIFLGKSGGTVAASGGASGLLLV